MHVLTPPGFALDLTGQVLIERQVFGPRITRTPKTRAGTNITIVEDALGYLISSTGGGAAGDSDQSLLPSLAFSPHTSSPSGIASGGLKGSYPSPEVVVEQLVDGLRPYLPHPQPVITALLDLFTSSMRGVVPGSGGGTTNFLRADGTWAAPPAGGPGSTTFGTATLDFGAFPGSNVASVDVVTTGVVVTSALSAWIRPVATADHTDADHLVAPMKVSAVFLSNDNIRIYGINMNDVIPPLEQVPARGRSGGAFNRQPSPMFVGQFSVGWMWS